MTKITGIGKRKKEDNKPKDEIILHPFTGRKPRRKLKKELHGILHPFKHKDSIKEIINEIDEKNQYFGDNTVNEKTSLFVKDWIGKEPVAMKDLAFKILGYAKYLRSHQSVYVKYYATELPYLSQVELAMLTIPPGSIVECLNRNDKKTKSMWGFMQNTFYREVEEFTLNLIFKQYNPKSRKARGLLIPFCAWDSRILKKHQRQLGHAFLLTYTPKKVEFEYINLYNYADSIPQAINNIN